MKLVVLQQSNGDLLPIGAIFEIPDHDRASAETLIAAGYARAYTEAEEPEPTSTTTRRTYRRRDLRAEDEP